MLPDISGYSEWIHFPFYEVFFFSRRLCFFWSPYLLLITELISLDTSGKPTIGFSLNFVELPSLFFYFFKKILIWQKMLKVFSRTYFNIVFWILLWMLTSLVLWNLNITVSTTPKYYYKKAVNYKLKLIGRTMKHFSKKLLGYKIFRSIVSWAMKFFLKTLKNVDVLKMFLYCEKITCLSWRKSA